MTSSVSRAAAKPLRLGVLGCANIARQFVRDVQGSAFVQVVAVASRDAAKAAAFAQEWGVPRHHAGYEALLADPGVDAVYIPLPNSLHAPWCLRAMAAGKHVLCEKPLTLSRREAEQLFAAARQHGVMLLEAYPYWFQPQTRDLLALLGGGADSVLGEVRSVQASFGFTLARPEGNIRMNPELGGGALLDAGSYPLSLIRLVMACAPVQVQAHARTAASGVDIATTATLLYADGRSAQMSCAMDTATHRHATLVGSRGVLQTEYLNHTHAGAAAHPWGYLPSRMQLRRGILNSVPFEDVLSATGSGFAFAAEAFARVVHAQDHAAIDRAAQASIDIAATLEAVALSARTGRPVHL
jgi:predicted dehydrogenase